MTFTYDLANGFNDRDRVRFAISDTDSSAAKFQDEEITALIAEEGTWQKATIACVENLIARVSQPNFSADWLTVDNASARKSYEALLTRLRRKLGISEVTMGATHTYRKDSYQTEEPTYDTDSDGSEDWWIGWR